MYVLNSTLSNNDKPIVEFILDKIQILKKETRLNRTLFAACPNSEAVLKAAIRSAKRCNAPIKFAATLNQVDNDGGYTGMTQKDFVETIKQEAEKIDFHGPIIIAVDHGGPWLKDKHKLAGLTLDETMKLVKNSLAEAMESGFHLLHVDPTVDIDLKVDEAIDINTVVSRTIEIIEHVEKIRRNKNLPKISYEVGTEEVHGGLADMKTFRYFLSSLKEGLAKAGLKDIWPCFIVGKVGTDLHTTLFDPIVAKELTCEAEKFGSLIKGHYSDNVSNPEDYPLSGMGAANIGPEFTEREYDALERLVEIESYLIANNKITKQSDFKNILWKAVIDSGRWKKWIHGNEDENDFYSIEEDRQLWLIKTGCRYIWANSEVFAARKILYDNLNSNGIDAEHIVLSNIENAMDKYFYRFNLVDLNDFL